MSEGLETTVSVLSSGQYHTPLLWTFRGHCSSIGETGSDAQAVICLLRGSVS